MFCQVLGMNNNTMQEKTKDNVLYRWLVRLTKWMDDYYLDPIIGLIPGAGDVLTSISGLPAVAFCLFVVKSVPLTLAVTFNVLFDVMMGCMPFFVGDLFDFFVRSHRKNLMLIRGYVDGDAAVVSEVRKKALVMSLGILLLIALIVLLIWGIGMLYQWVAGLF